MPRSQQYAQAQDVHVAEFVNREPFTGQYETVRVDSVSGSNDTRILLRQWDQGTYKTIDSLTYPRSTGDRKKDQELVREFSKQVGAWNALVEAHASPALAAN